MSTRQPSSYQTYIYALSLGLAFMLQLARPALRPLMNIIEVGCLLGILIFAPLELYQLCRHKKGRCV
ncbi:MAG: hypothetical protein M3036_05155 [Bifidobacteriales bacterium]|nr:hypothetical protein [Bombella sp. ESL0378]MCT6837024.1 hypothetical protein [Bifidobacteriales bacterium]MCT6855849.1 hypothetical protein [Bombella apis]MUG04275.1 hypothetical protein [Bombella sp. ESL0378]